MLVVDNVSNHSEKYILVEFIEITMQWSVGRKTFDESLEAVNHFWLFRSVDEPPSNDL